MNINETPTLEPNRQTHTQLHNQLTLQGKVNEMKALSDLKIA